MKFTINTDKQYTETEIIVNCSMENKDIEKLLEAIRSVIIEERTNLKEISKLKGEKNGKQYLLETESIIFTDTNEGRSYIYTVDGCFENSMKLYELEKALGIVNFFRANKSCLFNFNKIKAMENDPDRRIILTMVNDMKVVVSRQYAGNVKKKLEEYHV